jgi:hypothetical protein
LTEAEQFFFAAVSDALSAEHRAADAALWETLSIDDRAVAAARIVALCRYEKESDAATRARELGMAPTGFFKLLKRWRDRRSLASVLPQAAGRKRRPRVSGANDEVAAVVRSVVEAQPDRNRDAIVAEIRARLDDPPGVATVRALVDAERRARERDALGGDDGFGRRMLVASSPVVLQLGRRERAFAAIAGFVVDLATSRIIGSAVADSAIAAVREAAAGAADGLAAFTSHAGGPVDDPTYEIEIAGYPIDMATEIRRLSKLPIDASVVDVDFSVRTRSRLVEVLGPALGLLSFRIRLGPNEIQQINASLGRTELSPETVVERRLHLEIDRRAKEDFAGAPPVLAVDRGRLEVGLRLIAAQSGGSAPST